MTKSNNFQQGGYNTKRGVYGMDRRWRASRMEGVAKNKGTRMVRKPKKSKS